jgi:hypothetical protein
VLPVTLVNTKGLFIEKEKDLAAECVLPECLLSVHSYEHVTGNQTLLRTIIESFISGSTSVTVAALLNCHVLRVKVVLTCIVDIYTER